VIWRFALTIREKLAIALLIALTVWPADSEARAERPAELLERYRPLLRYDAQEEGCAQPVGLPPASAEVLRGDRVYGHLAREDGDIWLQYWLFYAYNPQDREPFGTGRHEGDWELVQLRLGGDGEPDLATLSQHSWAEGCAADPLELSEAGRKRGPVVYVANGSHANFSAPGDYGRPFPDPTDEAGGDGRSVRPAVSEIDDQSPGWVSYPGPWGETEAGFVPGESPSPPGPRFQESRAWSEPSSYHQRVARECGSGAPGRPAQTAALAIAAALALAGLLLALRRRRALRQNPVDDRS